MSLEILTCEILTCATLARCENADEAECCDETDS